VTKY